MPVSGKAALGRKGELSFDPVTLGNPVSLNLRGVVGFTDVLIKIMVTVDAELSRAERAEALFEKAFRAANRRVMLSATPRRRDAQVKERCFKAGSPVLSTLQPSMIFSTIAGSSSSDEMMRMVPMSRYEPKGWRASRYPAALIA